MTIPADSGRCSTLCEFRSELFRFRPIAPGDLALLFCWRTDEKQNRYLSSPAPRDLDEQRRWFERISHDPTCVYYMTYQTSRPGEPFGYTSITKIDHQALTAEIGVVIGSPADIGKGHSFYIGGALLTIAFRFFGLSTVYSSCNPENTLALRAIHSLSGKAVEGPSPYRKDDECLMIHTQNWLEESSLPEQSRLELAPQAFDMACTNPMHRR